MVCCSPRQKALGIGLACCLVLVSGCGEKQEAIQPEQPTAKDPASAPEALVKVNGSSITEREFDFAVSRTLGDAAALYMNEELANTILESLVASRAISQKALEEMSEPELQDIEVKTKAYREELLVKHYLEQNVTPQPVTNQMVTEYYQKYPEKFGGGAIKEFEYIELVLVKGEDAPAVEQRLQEVVKAESWATAVQQLKSTNPEWNPTRKQAQMSTSQLKEPLQSMLAGLEVGEISQPNVSGRKLTVVRLTDEKPLPPRALAEVSAEIRKSLAPLQLKKAVKAISDQVRVQADVQYKNVENNIGLE